MSDYQLSAKVELMETCLLFLAKHLSDETPPDQRKALAQRFESLSETALTAIAAQRPSDKTIVGAACEFRDQFREALQTPDRR